MAILQSSELIDRNSSFSLTSSFNLSLTSEEEAAEVRIDDSGRRDMGVIGAADEMLVI